MACVWACNAVNNYLHLRHVWTMSNDICVDSLVALMWTFSLPMIYDVETKAIKKLDNFRKDIKTVVTMNLFL